MKKLFLFLTLGIFFTLVSCDKSAKTEDLEESLELEQTFTKGEPDVTPIPLGATTMDFQLPDGETVTVDIPLEYQLNEDGTNVLDQPATSRSGACTNIITVLPHTTDAFTQWNIQTVTINFGGTSKTVWKPNNAIGSHPIDLDPGDALSISIDSYNNTYNCNDLLLIVFSWNCSGAQFTQMHMDFIGDLNNVGMGSLSICHDKCRFNPNWLGFVTVGC